MWVAHVASGSAALPLGLDLVKTIHSLGSIQLERKLIEMVSVDRTSSYQLVITLIHHV